MILLIKVKLVWIVFYSRFMWKFDIFFFFFLEIFGNILHTTNTIERETDRLILVGEYKRNFFSFHSINYTIRQKIELILSLGSIKFQVILLGEGYSHYDIHVTNLQNKIQQVLALKARLRS